MVGFGLRGSWGYQGMVHPAAACAPGGFLCPRLHEVPMSSRVTSRSSRTSLLRSRAAVLAAGLGVSVVLGAGAAYGNAMVIKHGNGTYSQYAHLSRIDVKVGQVVATGQHIARSGNTGNSSGPHLHFEIRTSANYGSAVDPVAFLRSKGVTV